MLTLDVLKQNTELAKLDDDTLNLFLSISNPLINQHVETTVAAAEKTAASDATKKAYGSIEKVVKDITGETKAPTEFTSDLVLKVLKPAWESKAKVSELEAKIKEGNMDATLKKMYEQQIQDAKTTAQAWEDKFKTGEKEWQKKFANQANDFNTQKLTSAFGIEKAGIVFKDTYGEALGELLEARQTKMLANVEVSTMDDGKGGKLDVLRDKTTNQVLLNPNNNMAPFSFGEYYRSNVSDLIDTGKTQGGAGGKKPGEKGGGGGGAFVLQATNQIDAMTEIRKHLAQKGVPVTDSRYRAMENELYDNNKVGEMPERAE